MFLLMTIITILHIKNVIYHKLVNLFLFNLFQTIILFQKITQFTYYIYQPYLIN